MNPNVKRTSIGAAGPARGSIDRFRLTIERARRLSQLMAESRPDALICFMPRMATAGVLAGRRSPVPVIISERTDPRHLSEPPTARRIRAWTYRHADALVVPSESLASWAVEHQPRRVRVIHNPVDPSVRQWSQGRERTIVALGRLGREKGIDLLIEAFARVADDRPGWRLKIFGDGPVRTELEEQARSTTVSHRIELAGEVAHARQALDGAGIFALPSRYEGFPNALLEALASGLPAIAARCSSGPAEILRDGQNGILVPTEDVASLAAGLASLMDDEGLRHRLSTAAAARAAEFGLDRIVADWDGLLEDMMVPQRVRRTA